MLSRHHLPSQCRGLVGSRQPATPQVLRQTARGPIIIQSADACPVTAAPFPPTGDSSCLWAPPRRIRDLSDDRHSELLVDTGYRLGRLTRDSNVSLILAGCNSDPRRLSPVITHCPQVSPRLCSRHLIQTHGVQSAFGFLGGPIAMMTACHTAHGQCDIIAVHVRTSRCLPGTIHRRRMALLARCSVGFSPVNRALRGMGWKADKAHRV